MLFLNLLLLFFSLATALIAILGDTYQKGEGAWRKRITRRGWLSILFLSLAFFTGVAKEMLTESELASAREDKLNRANERAQFEKDLRMKSEELAALNRTIASTVTGGDSYPFFWVGRPGKKSERADLVLRTSGQYPLYDVSVRVQDIEELLSAVNTYLEEHGPADSFIKGLQLSNEGSVFTRLGNLSPNQALPFTQLDLSGRLKASFKVTFMARNGSVQQDIVFHRIDGKWKYASRVRRAGKTLRKAGDENVADDW